MTKFYSFLKDKKTEEKHIFEGDTNPKGGCFADQKSICKKVTNENGNWIPDAICLNDNIARKKTAEIGRSVCGVCVSHLYTTY